MEFRLATIKFCFVIRTGFDLRIWRNLEGRFRPLPNAERRLQLTSGAVSPETLHSISEQVAQLATSSIYLHTLVKVLVSKALSYLNLRDLAFQSSALGCTQMRHETIQQTGLS